VGRFLHAHPLQDAPLALPGKRVRAGQALGLLQVGMLLIPVTAPRDGVVAAIVAADGALVGFGDRLVDLRPS
jgi:acetyl-CoA carboxylase biotin carboxyl carrier protein